MRAIRILQTGKIFGINYVAGMIVKNPSAGLVMRAENEDKRQGLLICEFAGVDMNPDALMQLTKVDLLKMAKEKGLEVDITATKKEIVRAILDEKDIENEDTSEGNEVKEEELSE